MESFNWTCPYCNHDQTVTVGNRTTQYVVFKHTDNAIGIFKFALTATYCANQKCREVTLKGVLTPCNLFSGHPGAAPKIRKLYTEKAQSWPLMPESNAKPQPGYIPLPIIDNYNQACRIRDLSPLAAATMARRCLQGMIRDFCKISKGTLFAEIVELEERVADGNAPTGVSPDSINALHTVRELGNIGAHMEENIDLIIEVDKGEVQTLITLVEALFRDWYVARHDRGKLYGDLAKTAKDKKEKKIADNGKQKTTK